MVVGIFRRYWSPLEEEFLIKEYNVMYMKILKYQSLKYIKISPLKYIVNVHVVYKIQIISKMKVDLMGNFVSPTSFVKAHR